MPGGGVLDIPRLTELLFQPDQEAGSAFGEAVINAASKGISYPIYADMRIALSHLKMLPFVFDPLSSTTSLTQEYLF